MTDALQASTVLGSSSTVIVETAFKRGPSSNLLLNMNSAVEKCKSFVNI